MRFKLKNMKAFFIFIIGTLFCGKAFSQCPEPGLKIQSAACDSPSNLRVSAITCHELTVQWRGQQAGVYTIIARSVDSVTGNSYEAQASKYSCDADGNCRAVIPVKEGTYVTYSVQGVCTFGGSTINGYKCEGAKVYIPLCQQEPATTSGKVRVYPNPSTGTLIVEYDNASSAALQFAVFDMAGRNVFSSRGDVIPRANGGYRLDLHNLTTGTYLLFIDNGKEKSQVKFLLTGN